MTIETYYFSIAMYMWLCGILMGLATAMNVPRCKCKYCTFFLIIKFIGYPITFPMAIIYAAFEYFWPVGKQNE